MALPFYNWSKVAANNASADATVAWPEGMAPSAVNDSARAMMASTAAYRDDVAGATVTGGTSTAYTVGTFQVFDTLAHLDKQVVAFTPHTTNGATVTLNVDSLGAKPLRAQPSVDLQSGILIQGTPYAAVYNNSDGAFYLFGIGTAPGIPVGGMIDFTGTTAPSSSFVLPFGQAISRTTYATYFAMVSTTFGVGDGSTTFNVPDLRGRVAAGADAMGGSAASRLTSSFFGATASLGATGGNEKETISNGNLPANIPNNLGATFSPSSGTSTIFGGTAAPNTNVTGGAAASVPTPATAFVLTGSVSITGTINGSGANTPLITVQPTMVVNKLLRII